MEAYKTVTKMSITLENSVAEELSSLASELNRKKSHLIEEALTLYFDKLDEQVADKRLKELESGKTQTIPASEVWASLGL